MSIKPSKPSMIQTENAANIYYAIALGFSAALMMSTKHVCLRYYKGNYSGIA